MIIYLKNKYTLQVDDFSFKCAVGKLGLTKKKIEGDQKTPKGIFNIENLYYRKDRVNKPETKLKTISIKETMGWCNDAKNKKNYNRLIKVNKKIKHEKLFRNDNKYNFLIPIKYNFKQRILGKGSCIFLHLTQNYKPTAGCIALKEKDFLILLRIINKKSKIII